MSCRYFAAFCLYRADTHGSRADSALRSLVPWAKPSIRNRIRRRMREAIRRQLTGAPDQLGNCVQPPSHCLDAPFEDLCRETARVFTRCNDR